MNHVEIESAHGIVCGANHTGNALIRPQGGGVYIHLDRPTKSANGSFPMDHGHDQNEDVMFGESCVTGA